MKLTKAFIEKVSPPVNKDQAFYRDDQLKGFALRVTANGVKSLVLETLIGNKVRRITLGKYGKLSLEQGRVEAKKLLGKREVTPDWLNKPLTSIKREAIAKRHTDHGNTRSKARANLAMRLLRAIFNFSMSQYQIDDGESIITDNPVARLSHTRAWYKIDRKQTIIKHHQLADWHKGILALTNHFPLDTALLWQDYFLFILFTGLRRGEATSLKWEQFDLKAKIFTLLDTKNRNTHTLPMSDFICDLLLRRRNATTSNFVFPSPRNEVHIIEPRKAMARVIQESNVKFGLHDLRRTFITTAESLDISAYALKRLLNHKMHNDVTSGYIITDVERLRLPMQKITNYLLMQMRMINNNTRANISSSYSQGIFHESHSTL